MNEARALDMIRRSGARLGIDQAGALVALDVPPELAPLVDHYRPALAWAVRGAQRLHVPTEKRWAWFATPNRPAVVTWLERKAAHHRWRVCDACGLAMLTASAGGKCRLTARCPGKARDLDGQPLELDGQPVPCARPGCTRAAVVLTVHLEPLCLSDFDHLALIDHQENHQP